MSVFEAIAAVAAHRVQELFADAEGGSMLRVQGLGPEEIGHLVDDLRSWRPPGAAEGLKVVVTTSQPWPGLPREVVLPKTASSTTFRNNDQPVVFLEHEEYSDAQGLRNVRSITDQELLAEPDGRARLLHHLRGGKPGERILLDALEVIFGCFRAAGHRTAPPVRRWAGFVGQVCKELTKENVLDARTVWTAIGLALSHAGLMPDSRLADGNQTSRARNLRRNVEQTTRLRSSSGDRDVDDLQDRVDGVVFREPDGTETSMEKARSLRAGFSRLIRSGPDAETLKGLDLRYWEQVESRKSDRKGLGERVMDQLAKEHPDRLDEFSDDLRKGLDDKAHEAAVEFLDLDPPEGQPRLSMLIDSPLRGALERVADPPQRATRAPLRKLLRGLHACLSEEGVDLGTLVLERRQRKAADDRLAAALFAWVYGATLREVVERSENSLHALQLEPALLDVKPMTKYIGRADERADSDSDGPEWADLRLQVRPIDRKTPLFSFEWRPRDVAGLIAFARLVHQPACASWVGLEESTFEDWLRSAQEPTRLDGGQPASDLGPLREWNDTRERSLKALQAGLTIAELCGLADAFERTLVGVRLDQVPQGERDPVAGALLEYDCFTADDGELVMLPTHPIRQRWIGTHFRNLANLLSDCLDGLLRLNPTNDGALFFDHLAKVGPHAQPALLVREDELRIAVREQDWAEHFEVLRDQRSARQEWLAGLDDGAIDEVAEVVGKYLAAYPHKVDGLHLLFMARRRSARSVERLVGQTLRQLRAASSERSELRISLLVEPDEIREVERVLQQFDAPDRLAEADFPQVEISLHEWSAAEGGSPYLAGVSREVDIAIVPNVFGAVTVPREATTDTSHLPTSFDPWRDEATQIRPADTGARRSTSVSRVLLPRGADSLLESWSTINTRQFRRRPVGSTTTSEDVDYFELQVPFGENADFFGQLHEVAHWVVTVDSFVGREQVDALENRPDVILVKSGVGSNDSYRMVVSSQAGRQFVVHRLERRLRDQLPLGVQVEYDSVAEELYDRARLLVPGIVLRSLGLGRTAAEMVGLVCARARIDETRPARLGGHGFEAWISLDEHADWLGGVRRSRADLARVVGRYENGGLHLEVLVVEAKMRRSVDLSRADEQLDRSVKLFQAALSSTLDFRDVPFWRRELLRAIEQASVVPGDRRAGCRIHVDGDVRVALDEDHRAALVADDGLRSVRIEGVLVTLADTGEVTNRVTPQGYEWLRLSIEELAALLGRLTDPATREDRIEATVLAGGDEALASPALPPLGPAQSSGRVASASGHERAVMAGETGSRGGESAAALLRYQEVLNALTEHKVEVYRADEEPAIEGPGFFVFRLQLGRGQKPAAVYRLGEEIKLALGLEAGHEPRMYADRGSVVIEIPKRPDERYYVDAAELWQRTEWPSDKLFAPLGADVRDRVVGLEFSSSKSPHLLIGGMTGGGKSVALETLLWGLVKNYSANALKLWLVDPKGNEFVQFDSEPHVRQPIGMDAEDAIELLDEAVAEMDRRYREMKELSRARKNRVGDVAAYNQLVAEDERFPWIMVVLDEFADLTSDREQRRTIEGLLQRLAQKARACGIHCVVATQKPSAEVISTTTRSNLGAQLALRVRSATDSRVIMEAGGAESLAGNGDGFLRLSGEEPIRLQCARYEPVG